MSEIAGKFSNKSWIPYVTFRYSLDRNMYSYKYHHKSMASFLWKVSYITSIRYTLPMYGLKRPNAILLSLNCLSSIPTSHLCPSSFIKDHSPCNTQNAEMNSTFHSTFIVNLFSHKKLNVAKFLTTYLCLIMTFPSWKLVHFSLFCSCTDVRLYLRQENHGLLQRIKRCF